MAKKIIQDIIVKKNKPRPIKPAPKPVKRPIKPIKPVGTPTKKDVVRPKRTLKKGKTIFVLLAFLLVILVGAKIVDAFSGAIIKIVPHKENLEVDTLFKAGKSTADDMTYETMEVQVTKETKVDATGTEEVATKASGQITIFNAYSSKPQSLIANTRFESSDGKIYRIKERIMVPGAKIEDGEIVPSSIDAVVYADEPGEEYNAESTNFKIPGFKGGPRYDKFYAETKTSIEGGFVGVLSVIPEDKKEKITEELESSIKNELFQKIRMQAPDDYVFYNNAVEIKFVSDENVNKPAGIEDNPKFVVKETGELLAFLLPKKSLTDKLVSKYLGNEFVGKVTIDNIEKLTFSLISYDEAGELIVFKIKGEANFVWIIEEEKLKDALIAQPKELEEVFKKFPSVDQASVVFRPSWWKFFPEKTSKISVEQNLTP